MDHSSLTYALKEEIGKPELFTGRQQDLDHFLGWVELVKEELGQSAVILGRKRRGKTALVQRLFNIIYSMDDPKVIPFYIRMSEEKQTQREFAVEFFCTLLSQYLGHKRRDLSLVRKRRSLDGLKALTKEDDFLHAYVCEMADAAENGSPSKVWRLAREAGHQIALDKDERIIQIIDEFQFLNDRIYIQEDFQQLQTLCDGYQHTASSKISPQIITGSYIGWLSAIVEHMVGRYQKYFLGPLPEEEALAAVYNYSSAFKRPVTDETVAYIIETCHRDPFYISSIFNSNCVKKDLTSKKTVLEILAYETVYPQGVIASIWMEYLWSAFERINDLNAKKIVLYLAKYGGESRNRKQILNDLKLEMTDRELEKRLHKLVYSDIISRGRSNYEYAGLGDPVFEIVFRKEYQSEVDETDFKEIEADFERRFKSLQGKVAYYKGIAAEHRVMQRLTFAGLGRVPAETLLANVPEGFELGPFASIGKRSFQVDQEHRVEVDIYCRSTEGIDLVVEVKDWERKVDMPQIEAFLQTRERLTAFLERPTAYLFYSEHGLSEAQEQRLTEAGVMFADGKRLSAYQPG